MANKDLFIWSKEYETKLHDVDDQHKYLVEQINTLSSKLFEQTLTREDLETIFANLIEYTKFHFDHEEKMMVKKSVHKDFVKEHIKNHKSFVKEIQVMYSEIVKDEIDFKKVKTLRDFLINWLAFHILEQDRRLGAQICLIEEGKSPKKAYKKVVVKKNSRTGPLVQALKGMMEVLSHRNKDLVELKSGLEVKVEERTKELIEANKILEELSMTDQLTAIANRRFALKTLKHLWKDVEEFGAQLSCLMLDADHFKEVNDTFGHDAGDRVLKALSASLKHAVRTDDIVCRLGGDEFLIICPMTDFEGAMTVAQNVHTAINSLKVPCGQGENYQGSVSIGVASSSYVDTVDELIKKADDGVYKAKKAGKNCIRYVEDNLT